MAGAPPVLPVEAALDGLGAPDLGHSIHGNRSAGNPLTTLGRHVNTIMARYAVV